MGFARWLFRPRRAPAPAAAFVALFVVSGLLAALGAYLLFHSIGQDQAQQKVVQQITQIERPTRAQLLQSVEAALALCLADTRCRTQLQTAVRTGHLSSHSVRLPSAASGGGGAGGSGRPGGGGSSPPPPHPVSNPTPPAPRPSLVQRVVSTVHQVTAPVVRKVCGLVAVC